MPLESNQMNKITEKLNAKFSRLEMLEDGWADYEKNKKFTPNFLYNVKDGILDIFRKMIKENKSIFFPVIAPMEINSIDIHWKNSKFQLLINIKEIDGSGNVQLFGRDFNSSDNDHRWNGNIKSLSNAVSWWLLLMI